MSREIERQRLQERDAKQQRVYERANARMVLLGSAPDLVDMLGLGPGGVESGRYLSRGFVETGQRIRQASRETA